MSLEGLRKKCQILCWDGAGVLYTKTLQELALGVLSREDTCSSHDIDDGILWRLFRRHLPERSRLNFGLVSGAFLAFLHLLVVKTC